MKRWVRSATRRSNAGGQQNLPRVPRDAVHGGQPGLRAVCLLDEDRLAECAVAVSADHTLGSTRRGLRRRGGGVPPDRTTDNPILRHMRGARCPRCGAMSPSGAELAGPGLRTRHGSPAHWSRAGYSRHAPSTLARRWSARRSGAPRNVPGPATARRSCCTVDRRARPVRAGAASMPPSRTSVRSTACAICPRRRGRFTTCFGPAGLLVASVIGRDLPVGNRACICREGTSRRAFAAVPPRWSWRCR